jgi:hypothetical protein
LEPLALVMSWSTPTAYDHVRRLEADGLVRRIPMTYGGGAVMTPSERTGASLVVVTRAATDAAPRNVAPTSWAHVSACAWTAAWLELHGHSWLSGREVAGDGEWRGVYSYEDAQRVTHEQSHRPDMGMLAEGDPDRRRAIEVELQRKSSRRLRGILRHYRRRSTAAADGVVDLAGGVLYVVGNPVVMAAVREAAAAAELGEHPAGPLRAIALDDVIAQTRARGEQTRRERRGR